MQQQSTVLTMAMFWQRRWCWCDIVVLNVHPTNKDKVIMPRRVSTGYPINLSTTTKCCQEHKTLQRRYFKTNNSEHNLHERSNDNGIRVLNFATSKIPCSHIKTLIQTPAFIPNGRYRIKWITSCWTQSVCKHMYMQMHKFMTFQAFSGNSRHICWLQRCGNHWAMIQNKLSWPFQKQRVMSQVPYRRTVNW